MSCHVRTMRIRQQLARFGMYIKGKSRESVPAPFSGVA
jgi:hypothetical protein